MSYQMQGKLLEKYETQVINERFRKREMVIQFEENPNFPQFIKFELKQDRCSLLDNFAIGDKLEVHFNLTGRKWINKEGKLVYFTTLEAWKITALTTSSSETVESIETPTSEPPVVSPSLAPAAGAQDDLPF